MLLVASLGVNVALVAAPNKKKKIDVANASFTAYLACTSKEQRVIEAFAKKHQSITTALSTALNECDTTKIVEGTITNVIANRLTPADIAILSDFLGKTPGDKIVIEIKKEIIKFFADKNTAEKCIQEFVEIFNLNKKPDLNKNLLG